MKHVVHFLFGMVLCVAATSLASAQGDFRPGYIVPEPGDTLTGWVDYRAPSLNEQQCRFRRTPDGAVEVFDSRQLTAYGFEGDRGYVALIPPAGTELVFMEALVQGVVSLFLYKEVFFLLRPGRELVALELVKEPRLNGSQRGFRTFKKYIGFLRLYCNDCSDPAFSDRLERTALRQPDLVRLLAAYHNCTGDTVRVFKQNKPFLEIRPGMLGGVHSTSLRFVPNQPASKYLASLEGEFRPLPVVGVQCVFDFPRLTERFSLLLGGSYVINRYQGYSEVPFGGYLERSDLYVEMTSVKIPLAMQYRLPIRPGTFFLHVGVSGNFNLETRYHRIQERELPTRKVLTEEGTGNGNEPFYPGVWTGLGVRLPLGLFVEGRLEWEPGKMTQTLAPSRANAAGIQLLAGIHF